MSQLHPHLKSLRIAPSTVHACESSQRTKNQSAAKLSVLGSPTCVSVSTSAAAISSLLRVRDLAWYSVARIMGRPVSVGGYRSNIQAARSSLTTRCAKDEELRVDGGPDEPFFWRAIFLPGTELRTVFGGLLRRSVSVKESAFSPQSGPSAAGIRWLQNTLLKTGVPG
jgi:hypothetical protein